MRRAEGSRVTDAATPRKMRRPDAEASTRHARARRAAWPKLLFWRWPLQNPIRQRDTTENLQSELQPNA
jgi:hypothetical protein